MSAPLNYTIDAISSLNALRDSASVGPFDRQGIDFISALLRRAEVFVLPDRGELLDRSKVRPQVPGAMFHPPFPVVALEYRASNPPGQESHPFYEATDSSKRIALAWEWDGKMPFGAGDAAGPSSGEGVCIASLSYIDKTRTWVPMCGAIMIPFDCGYYEAAPTEHGLAMLNSGRISAKQAAAPAIEISGVLPLMPDWMGALFRDHGQERALGLLSADLMDEVNAFIDLCLALACNNVESVKQAQPPKLNKARIRRGKLPLPDFHLLTLGGEAYSLGSVSSSEGTGVRSHLRRGHIRRLSADRVTWVNSTIVNGKRQGFVSKAYAPQRVA